MNIYIVLQDVFCEGNFGDTELSETKILGVYLIEEKAKAKIRKTPKSFFYEAGLRGGKRENVVYLEKHKVYL